MEETNKFISGFETMKDGTRRILILVLGEKGWLRSMQCRIEKNSFNILSLIKRMPFPMLSLCNRNVFGSCVAENLRRNKYEL